MTTMTALSSAPYKGTRDFYPEDKRVQNYIFKTWRRVAERYGYEEYGAPILEPLEVYAAKSGQEIVNEQTYSFTDRGDRVVAIRPEMTPSISRMVAAHRQELAYPARLYSIANFMRYERPQRGREREFWQLNVDVFGVDNVRAEAEIITMGANFLKEFGAKRDMYEVRINHRGVINYMMAQYLGLDAIQSQLMIKLFDRKNKLSPEDFRDQAIDIFGESMAEDGLKKIVGLLRTTGAEDMPEEIKGSDSIKELAALFEQLEANGVKNAKFDVTLMRGLDYYTGIVFEYFDTDPENRRSLFGGGRYDGLVGMFGAEPLSAVGMAPGYTMTELFLQTHGLLPDFSSTTEVYLVVLGEAADGADKLARLLRKEGVKTEVDVTGRKLDKQLKSAVKKKIPYMIFIGDDEVQSGIYPLKETATATEEKLSPERLIARIKDRRRDNADDDIFDV